MPGRHKWSELKSRMTPERRELMAAKTAEIRSMLPPVTYAQVCWAASKYKPATISTTRTIVLSMRSAINVPSQSAFIGLRIKHLTLDVCVSS